MFPVNFIAVGTLRVLHFLYIARGMAAKGPVAGLHTFHGDPLSSNELTQNSSPDAADARTLRINPTRASASSSVRRRLSAGSTSGFC
jgi:hypothetical protein